MWRKLSQLYMHAATCPSGKLWLDQTRGPDIGQSANKPDSTTHSCWNKRQVRKQWEMNRIQSPTEIRSTIWGLEHRGC